MNKTAHTGLNGEKIHADAPADSPRIDLAAATSSATLPAADDFDEQNRLAQTTDAPPLAISAQAVDLADLPDDVKANLTGLDNIELDQLLLTILSTPGHIYNVDKIVITLWTAYRKKYDRMRVMARLRSLAHQQLVTKQAKARGIYTITPAGRELITPPAAKE